MANLGTTDYGARVAGGAGIVPMTGARRAALDLATVALAESDTSSLEAWAALLGVSRSTLKNRLRLAGISGKEALAFGRLARAILRGDADNWRPEDVMESMDERTFRALLVRSHVFQHLHGKRPSLASLFSGHVLTIPPEPLRVLWPLLRNRTGEAWVSDGRPT